MLITGATFYPAEIEEAEAKVDIVILGHIILKGLYILKDRTILYPSNIKPSNPTVDTILRGQILTFYWDYTKEVRT